MKTSIAWMLLAVSLVFNVFVVLGYSRASDDPALTNSETDIVSLVSNRLDLDQSQAATFQRLQTEMEEDFVVYQDSLALVQRQILDELNQGSPDMEHMREMIEQSAELQHEWKTASADRFGTFVVALQPEQRRELLQTLYQKDRRERFFAERLKRFDKDGDGDLNEAEEAEAKAYFEKMRSRRHRSGGRSRNSDTNGDGVVDEQESLEADRRQKEWQARKESSWRKDLLNRFDGNANGEIDSEELALLHEWLMTTITTETTVEEEAKSN